MSIEDEPHGVTGPGDGDGDLRARAVAQLRKRADFRTHLLIYLAVNLFLVAIWWFTTPGFFWPLFPIGGWGIGLLAHAWDTYGPEGATEEQIRRQIGRMRR
jgi:2TM domain